MLNVKRDQKCNYFYYKIQIAGGFYYVIQGNKIISDLLIACWCLSSWKTSLSWWDLLPIISVAMSFWEACIRVMIEGHGSLIFVYLILAGVKSYLKQC